MIQDRAAELACLALLLSENETTVLEGLSVFTAADFICEDGDIARIVRAIEACVHNGRGVSLLAIRTELQYANDDLTRIGGMERLLQLASEYPCSHGHVNLPDSEGGFLLADMAQAASLVREKSDARRLIAICESTADALRRPDGITTPLAKARLAEVINDIRDNTAHGAVSDAEADQTMQTWLDRLTGDRPVGIDTGFEGFDDLTGGLHAAGYVLITAADKQGKTQLGMTILDYGASRGVPVLHVLLESTALEHRCRRIAMNSNRELPYFKLISNRRRLSLHDRDVARDIWARLVQQPFYIVDDVQTPDRICQEIERQCIVNGVQVVLIDYLQAADFGQSGEGPISDFSKKIMRLGNRMQRRGIHLTNIVLNQMNAQGAEEAKRWDSPSSDHSYGSKQPKKDATVITAVKMEDEKFVCGCPVQTVPKRATTSQRELTKYVPRWERRPSTGVCPDCVQAGRDGTVINTNPVRQGYWIIEKSRNSAAGITIPFEFEGMYMLLREVRQQRPRSTEAETAAHFNW